MIIKNFLKNKKTLIYIFLVVIIFIIFTLLGVIQEAKKNYANSFFKEARIEFRFDMSEYAVLQNNKNVKKLVLGIDATLSDGSTLMLMQDETGTLKGNELIGDPRIFADYSIGDTINFQRINYDFILKEKTFYDFELNYIAPDTFLKVTDNFKRFIYYVYLEDWSKLDNFLDTLRYDGISFNIRRGNYDLTNSRPVLINYTLLTILLLATTGLIVAYLIINIIMKNPEKDYLYQALGFTKRKLFLIRIVKFLLVCLIGLAIYSFFYLIVSIF